MNANIKNRIKKIIKENYKFVIFLVVLVCFFYIKLPYYIMAPGGTINITDRVVMDGYHEKEGSLNMLYVSEYDATPASSLLAKIKGYDIEKIKERQISNESTSDIEKRNKLMRDNSLDVATLVAYQTAGKQITIKNKQNVVAATTTANGLKVGDIIKKVDGIECEDVADIKKIISNKEVGDTVIFTILRDQKEKEVQSTINMTGNTKTIGVIIITKYDYDTSPEITIKFKNSESGASGGLMLTLTIYNAISGEDIIKGRNIAGTGTINSDGIVGEISGIEYKVMGAAKNKIDLVFVPTSNYAKALSTKEKYHYNLQIVAVNTFKEALDYLRNN